MDKIEIMFLGFILFVMLLLSFVGWKMKTNNTINATRASLFCQTQFGENYSYIGYGSGTVVCAEPGESGVSGVMI